jgi:hypothetical protein
MTQRPLSSILAALCVAFAGTMAGQPVQAGPTPDVVTGGNAWTITFYDDSSPTHAQWATQNLCFVTTGTVGTQLAGYWYSTSFNDWNGTWRQEGDQVFMTGDYAGDNTGNAVGHDGMEWQLVTAERKAEGFGHWKEWRENGAFGQPIGYGNAKFVRVGSCSFQPVAGVAIPTLEKLVLEQSRLAPRRYRKDGLEALGPMDLDMLPIQ